MKIETKVTVIGVGRADEGSGNEVEFALGGQRSFSLKVDKSTAVAFAAKLYQDHQVRLTVDTGPEEPPADIPSGTVYDRYVRAPYRLAKDHVHGVFAVGRTPEEAIDSYAVAVGWGELEDIADLTCGDPCFTWGRTFTAGGTSFKAAGWDVPGGVVLTWWK